MIDRFNKWYDRLPGTPRFLLFMSVMSLAIFPLQIGLAKGNQWLALFGLTLLSIMTFVACVRATAMKSMQRVVAIILGIMMTVFVIMVFVSLA